MKHRAAFFSVIVGLLALFVGSVSAQDPVKLTYAIWDNNQLPAHEQIIEAFEAENPGIDVEIQVVPWQVGAPRF